MSRAEQLPPCADYVAWETQSKPAQPEPAPKPEPAPAGELAPAPQPATQLFVMTPASLKAAAAEAAAAREARLGELASRPEPEPEPEQRPEPDWLRAIRASPSACPSGFPNADFWGGGEDNAASRPAASTPTRISFGRDSVEHIPPRPKVLIEEALDESALAGAAPARAPRPPPPPPSPRALSCTVRAAAR